VSAMPYAQVLGGMSHVGQVIYSQRRRLQDHCSGWRCMLERVKVTGRVTDAQRSAAHEHRTRTSVAPQNNHCGACIYSGSTGASPPGGSNGAPQAVNVAIVTKRAGQTARCTDSASVRRAWSVVVPLVLYVAEACPHARPCRAPHRTTARLRPPYESVRRP
jgi:hypothetical protein